MPGKQSRATEGLARQAPGGRQVALSQPSPGSFHPQPLSSCPKPRAGRPHLGQGPASLHLLPLPRTLPMLQGWRLELGGLPCLCQMHFCRLPAQHGSQRPHGIVTWAGECWSLGSKGSWQDVSLPALLPAPPAGPCLSVPLPSKQDPSETLRDAAGGGPQMVWAIWGTTRSPVWGQGKMAWAFASPASTRSDVIGTMPASHSDTEPAQPLPLLAQGHCRRPEAAPCWSAQLRRRRRRLLGKGCLSGGSGWNFRHSGSAPPRPTGPACPSPSSEPPPPRCPGAPLPSRATRVRPWSTPVKGTASSIPSGFKPHHPLPTGQPGSVT